MKRQLNEHIERAHAQRKKEEVEDAKIQGRKDEKGARCGWSERVRAGYASEVHWGPGYLRTVSL